MADSVSNSFEDYSESYKAMHTRVCVLEVDNQRTIDLLLDQAKLNLSLAETMEKMQQLIDTQSDTINALSERIKRLEQGRYN